MVICSRLLIINNDNVLRKIEEKRSLRLRIRKTDTFSRIYDKEIGLGNFPLTRYTGDVLTVITHTISETVANKFRKITVTLDILKAFDKPWNLKVLCKKLLQFRKGFLNYQVFLNRWVSEDRC